MSAFLDRADELQEDIRDYLATSPDGGRFTLPDMTGFDLVIPLMVMEFNHEGWDVEYDYDENGEWLQFERQTSPGFRSDF